MTALQNNTSNASTLRALFATDVFVEALRWDRIGTVSASITPEFGIVLEIDGVYCDGCSDDYNHEAAIESVDEFAKTFWGLDGFGATLDDGSGAIGLKLTNGGRVYLLTAAEMIAIQDFTLSAADAMA